MGVGLEVGLTVAISFVPGEDFGLAEGFPEGLLSSLFAVVGAVVFAPLAAESTEELSVFVAVVILFAPALLCPAPHAHRVIAANALALPRVINFFFSMFKNIFNLFEIESFYSVEELK